MRTIIPNESAWFRSFQEVAEDTPEKRRAWWNPQAKEHVELTQASPEALRPPAALNWKLWAISGFVAVVGAAAGKPGAALFGVGGLASYFALRRHHRERVSREMQRVADANVREEMWEAQVNAPVEATALRILSDKITSARERATNQIVVDLGLTAEELSEAVQRQELITHQAAAGPRPEVAVDDDYLPPRRIGFVTAVITDRGLGYHTTTYDVVEDLFYPGEAEMMLWNRVNRVFRDRNELVIEATNGGSRRLKLDGGLRYDDSGTAELPDTVIMSAVNPFLAEAQRRLADSLPGGGRG